MTKKVNGIQQLSLPFFCPASRRPRLKPLLAQALARFSFPLSSRCSTLADMQRERSWEAFLVCVKFLSETWPNTSLLALVDSSQ